ncbi:hypothetical protein [Spirosoma sp.]|uniref:hypothetical protein n=1 Tax=Spirosoma sp. TaxID=1899569 RepID=UPI003B3A2FA4
MKRRTFLKNSSTTGSLALITPSGILQVVNKQKPSEAAESVVDAFVNPPMSSRAQVWWHWMNGNVTALFRLQSGNTTVKIHHCLIRA